jgi:hypothetical protein
MPPELLADLRNILAEHKILTEHLIECPAMAAEAATAPVPCVYFDQPGHTPDQRPDPIGVWPDDWPMCPPCAAIAKGADADHPEAAPR